MPAGKIYLFRLHVRKSVSYPRERVRVTAGKAGGYTVLNKQYFFVRRRVSI
jgi:hypothetical protein